MISATVFRQAMAGVGAFPWDRATCEAAIGGGRSAAARSGGIQRGVRGGIEALADLASPSLPPGRLGRGRATGSGEAPCPPSPTALPTGEGTDSRLSPDRGREIAALGYARCVDYQDKAYADLFARRVLDLTQAAGAGSPEAAMR